MPRNESWEEFLSFTAPRFSALFYHNSQKSHVLQKNPARCIISIQKKTGFSRASLLLVGPRLLNFAAPRSAAQRGAAFGGAVAIASQGIEPRDA